MNRRNTNNELDEVIEELRGFIRTDLERPATEAGLAYLDSWTADHGYEEPFDCADDTARRHTIVQLWRDIQELDREPSAKVGEYIGNGGLAELANQIVADAEAAS